MIAARALVNAFVVDAILKSVFSSTLAPVAMLRLPNPFAKRTLPSCTTPTDTPGIPLQFKIFATKAESWSALNEVVRETDLGVVEAALFKVYK